jgi:hypothetical protein
VALSRAIYSSATQTVMLTAKKAPLALSPALVLTINGNSLVDSMSRDIDATGSGNPGGTYKAMLSKAGAVKISAVEQGKGSHPTATVVDTLRRIRGHR